MQTSVHGLILHKEQQLSTPKSTAITRYYQNKKQRNHESTLRCTYLLGGLLVLVTLARQAYANPGGHVAHTLGEEELVELSVHTHVATCQKNRPRSVEDGWYARGDE